MLNGNEWEPMVINGERMAKQWENSNGICHYSLLMEDQWNITGNILVVLITIQFQWEFNSISLGIF